MDGVVSLDEFKDLKKKIEHLEYDEIKTIKEEVSDMKNNMTRTETLLEQNIKSSDRLSDTLDKVQDTMIHLSDSMQHNNKAVDKLSNKVTNLEEKIDKVEENDKISIGGFIKEHWFNLVIVFGMILYILFRQYIKI
jgi:methyl-accepting chemotaxis protein